MQVDLLNTPGIYYALAYIISATLSVSLHCRKPLRKWLAGYMALSVILVIFMMVQVPKQWFIPCMTLDFLLLYGMLQVACRLEWKTALYMTCWVFLRGEFAAALEWQLFYYGLETMGLPLNMVVNLCFLIPCHGIVFSIFWILEHQAGPGSKGLAITGRQLFVAVIITISVYALSNLSYAFTGIPFSSTAPHDIFALRTLADLVGVVLLFGYHTAIQEVQSRQEVTMLESVVAQQMENYRISKDSMDLVNQKYHDLKHQIAYLRSNITEEEKAAMLDSMAQEVRVFEASNHTGNEVVDTVLMSRQLQAQREGVSMTVVADGSAMDFLPTTEICSLLGNALENAVEAAAKMADPDQRLVSLSLDQKNGFLRLRVENRYEGTIHFRDGIPSQTTKDDRRLHGYGVRSMQTVAAAYNGTLSTETEDGWFRLKVLIPIPKAG